MRTTKTILGRGGQGETDAITLYRVHYCLTRQKHVTMYVTSTRTLIFLNARSRRINRYLALLNTI